MFTTLPLPTPSIEGPQTGGLLPTPSIERPQTRGLLPTPSIEGPQTRGLLPTPSIEGPQTRGLLPTPSIEGPQTGGLLPTPSIEGPQTAGLFCEGLACYLLTEGYRKLCEDGAIHFRCKCADGLGFDGDAVRQSMRGGERSRVCEAAATRPPSLDLTTLHIPPLGVSHE